MSIMKNIFDKLFKYIPKYVFGLVAFILGILGYMISLILTPAYIMWKTPLSNLLVAEFGYFARIGLIVSSIIAIPYIIALGRTQIHGNEFIRKIAVFTGIFACVSAILSGIVAANIYIIATLHGFFVVLSWISGAITTFAFSLLMLKNPNFSRSIITSGFIVAGIFIGFLIPFFITNFCKYFPTICLSFGQMVYVILPTWEWVVVLSILYWYFSNSVYMFYKKDL